jgi:hypothetical protein
MIEAVINKMILMMIILIRYGGAALFPGPRPAPLLVKKDAFCEAGGRVARYVRLR